MKGIWLYKNIPISEINGEKTIIFRVTSNWYYYNHKKSALAASTNAVSNCNCNNPWNVLHSNIFPHEISLNSRSSIINTRLANLRYQKIRYCDQQHYHHYKNYLQNLTCFHTINVILSGCRKTSKYFEIDDIAIFARQKKTVWSLC